MPTAPPVTFLRSTVVPRMVLLANHVLAAEPAATTRFKPMSGRRIDVRIADLPPPLAWAGQGLFDVCLGITAAGLLEWVEAPQGPADLQVTVNAANPLELALRAAAGERPDVRIEGDAALAAEVSWMMDHLRWDLEDDLSRLVGPAIARQFARVGTSFVEAVRRFAAGAADLAAGLGGTGPRRPAEPGRGSGGDDQGSAPR